MDLQRLAEQNPWWRDPAAIDQDFHLRELSRREIRLVHPVETGLDLGRAGIYVLRGPRQVGKTTLLKRLVRGRLAADAAPRNVLYFSLDVGDVRARRSLLDLLRTLLGRVPDGERTWVFLDEITFCDDWAYGLKAAFDLGLLGGCTVVVTGSHSLDLRKGSERLPGRRGDVEGESDQEMTPFRFPDVAGALQPGVQPARARTWALADLFEAAEENAIRFPDAARAFDLFLRGGGMPIALDDVLRAGRITPAASAVYLQAMLGDVLRAGKNESVFREVVRAVLTLGGEPTDWQGLAQRVSVGSRNTVKDYLDVMARCFLLVVLDQPRALGATTPAPRKARKLHVPDPFFHHVLTAWAQGHPDADTIASRTLGDPSARGRLVESAVAGHLAPRFAQTLFWRGRSEIDLIGVHASGEQLRVEVKYRARITSTDRRPLERSGGGLLLTRDTLAWEPAVALVPVPLLLLSLPAV